MKVRCSFGRRTRALRDAIGMLEQDRTPAEAPWPPAEMGAAIRHHQLWRKWGYGE